MGAGRAVTEVDGAPGAFVRPLMVDAPFTRGFVEVRAASELTLTFASPFRAECERKVSICRCTLILVNIHTGFCGCRNCKTTSGTLSLGRCYFASCRRADRRNGSRRSGGDWSS